MNSPVKMAEIARIAREVSYDPDTGKFTWLVTKRGKPAGRIAGGLDAKGYVVIKSGGFPVKAHRLAWFIVHGELPDLIDHINGDPADNRIVNLRPADKRLNNLNRRKVRPDSQSGIMGVSPIAGTDKWAARITENGKRVHLGSFDTAEQAHAHYLAVKAEKIAEVSHAH